MSSRRFASARPALLAACGALVLCGCSGPPDGAGFVRGAWLAEHGEHGLASARGADALRRLDALGVEWLAVGPVVHLRHVDAPELRFGEDDAALRRHLRRARSLGFRLMLLPRIESPDFFEEPFPFRADIAMTSNEDWERFHDNYEAMLLHYGRLCAEEDVDLFVIGLEYRASVKHAPERWRRMAAAVRGVYRGLLSYSANWWKEFEEVTFWDALDFIGIGAYFELVDAAVLEGGGVSVPALVKSWDPIKERLRGLSRRYGRPVLFTEVGYTTYADTAAWPWKWQTGEGRRIAPKQQAECWEALFRALAHEPWFHGLFVWRFYTDPTYVEPWEYTPEGRPAEAVIRKWFHAPVRGS